MSKKAQSTTNGERFLQDHAVPYEPRPYKYIEKGGTANAARQLGVNEHMVVKTLVMQDDGGKSMIVLMHGDRQVSTKNLARAIGAKRVFPCKPEDAHRHTGYTVGGISPFGTRKPLPVYVELTIFDLERVIINGGRRGFLVEVRVADLERCLDPTPVEVAILPESRDPAGGRE